MRRKVLLSFAICFFFLFITITPLTLHVNASSDGYVRLLMLSVSMQPTLEVGDILTVKTNVTASQIYASPKPDGDIIAFYRPIYPRDIIIHRAVQKSYQNGTWYFATQGDANPSPDM